MSMHCRSILGPFSIHEHFWGMEIILSPLCASLTGALAKNHGYSLRMSRSADGKKRCFAVRHPEHVEPNGHWLFILDCAQMAHTHFFADDIVVPLAEIKDALAEAGIGSFEWFGNYGSLNAKDVLLLKKMNNL